MKKILIVDNHPALLMAVQKALEKRSFDVRTAQDGLNAIDVLETFRPDIIFVDLIMPNIDGATLCRIIRKNPELENTYITILSAVAAEEEIDSAAMNVDACIAKGAFDEMVENILFVINHPEEACKRCQSGEIIGIDRIVPRTITSELLETKKNFEVVLEGMSDGIFLLNDLFRIVYANSVAVNIFGRPEEAVLGLSFHDLFNPEYQPRIEGLLERGVDAEDPDTYRIGDRKVRIERREVESTSNRSVIVVQDETERCSAEHALRESEEKYRILVESASEGVLVLQNLKAVFANRVICEVLEMSSDEILIHQNPFEFVHPDDREMVMEKHLDRIHGGVPVAVYSFRIVSKTGKVRWVDASGTIIDWQGEPATLNLYTDITPRKEAEKEREKLEAELLKASKLEAIGTMAGGIAHDFNNVLMGIQGRTSLMRHVLEKENPHYKYLVDIEEQVESAARLTQQLLGFARGGKYLVELMSVNQMVRDTVNMFGRTRKELQVGLNLQKNIGTVEADRGQLDQVLLNMCVNAWQAMPGGGELHIETESLTMSEAEAAPLNLLPGEYVRISVRDTGIGMDPEVRERVFEPFFTTKERSSGTGLGLAMAYGIIRNHGGAITVDSVKGKGTTFFIYLPMTEGKISEEKPSETQLLKGTETVLIVDDEAVVVRVGIDMLESLGYTVLTAANGQEAIEQYYKHRDEIAIVVLDMVMPGLSGGETYNRLKEISPKVKVLIASGYSLDGEATGVLARGADGFVQKPYNLPRLSTKIRQILDR